MSQVYPDLRQCQGRSYTARQQQGGKSTLAPLGFGDQAAKTDEGQAPAVILGVCVGGGAGISSQSPLQLLTA